MRVGHNPMLNARAEALPGMAAVVITHLPNLRGYHEHRLEVVQACLMSLRANAQMTLPVLVWDNGSGRELLDWLMDEYHPEYLVSGPNIGKASARASALRMFPAGTVLCFTDDDMLFYPGWLGPQLKLLNGFPDVGAVSGMPVRTPQRGSFSATELWARQSGAVVETGQLIPARELADFAISLGITGGSVNQFLTAMGKEIDIRISYKGMRAYANAQHCQFVCVNERLIPLTTWERTAMINEKPFDAKINAAGLLRLTTVERLTRHMGNVLDEDLREVIGGWNL